MSKKTRYLTADEKKLWRRVASGVKTRRPLAAEPEEAEAPPPRVAPKVQARAAPPVKQALAPKQAAAPPANRGAEKRVRRGKLEIGASFDLHGYTQDSGRAALIRFLQVSYARGDRTVIVITGAWRAGQGVLRQRLPDWLGTGELKPLVAGYAQAHRAHGGTGAFYVFLKRRATD